ncbi:MAG: OmpA family protein [Sphingobacteriaceae bacterium]|nr:OmpA family protein [Sphingobacteriaceae bacterium]
MQIKILILLFALPVFAFTQISKGDAYYSKSQYFKAIPKYKKALKGNSSQNQEAHLKLADCYKNLNDYANAEESYKKALAISHQVPAEVFFNYGQVLKTNNKYPEAVEQYGKYLKLNPKDANASKAVKFCKEIKYYMSKPIEYEVKNIEKINTEKSEFSPLVFNNKLAFVAEKESFNFVDYSVNDYNGEPYLNMYVTDIHGTEAKKSKTLSKRINAEYHDGPGSISADGKTFYFTRVNYKKKKNFINTAQIFVAKGEERKWKDITPFKYNSDNYSVAHPSISYDNNFIFFTSDMPGGYGGKDIWFCKWNGSDWDKPVNLGPDINTSADEMFPTIRKDGTLYFSSTGLPGFGGLDIYSAKLFEGKWILIRNEGLNINSSFDDFGITFLNDSIGYFSSNRTGGKGKDDIYWYKYTDKALIISGTVYLTENGNDPAKGIKVILAETNGKRIDSVKTTTKGFFEFKNFDADKKYMAIIDTDDPQFTGKARYFLADKNNVVQRITNKQGNNKFVFKNLPFDPNSLPDLQTDDDLTLAGNLLYGESPSKPIKNTKLKLTNDAGDVLEEITTNEFGAFAFRNIPSDQNYLISIEETDINLPNNTKVILTNKSGKELKTFYTGSGKFKFKVLSADKGLMKEMDVEDVNLSMDVFGYMYDQNKKPIASAKFKIKEEGSKAELQEVITAENGKFNFKNLKGDKNYLFETDEKDPVLSGVKRIYIADNKGRIYKVIDKDGYGRFTFKMLDADKTALGEFVVDDPWMEVMMLKNKQNDKNKKKELTIIENIYYASGDYKFDNAAQKVLDKVITVLNSNSKLLIELSSHTDSKASDDFNLRLSQKRAQHAVNYLISKGIDKKRLKAVGYGETKLLNRCVNGVDCYDEEHAKNRRTEFKITESPQS